MKQALHRLAVATAGPGLYDVTDELAAWVGGTGIQAGLLTVFIQHTSASLTIQENADPDVLRDLTDFFRRLVPEDSQRYRHVTEGPDDMPGHIRSALTATQLAIPVQAGRLALGTWQAVYVFEHRAGRFQRHLALHLIGE
ncbi:MAG TPA: secondary thiamine-phosphate synthase enzyme YjbQ [Candidatus Binatia bacterium]|jgi:secondary thiamine-phosphate synthase enzyme